MVDKQVEGAKTAAVELGVVEIEGIDSLIRRETLLKADGRRITYYSRVEVGKSDD